MLVSPTGQAFHQGDRDEATKLMYTWANSESWNPGYKGQEIEIFHSADPKGFIYSTIDVPATDSDTVSNGDQKSSEEKKEVVSVISAIRYGEDQGWIGYYIASPKHRGKGYGIATFNRALEHLNHNTRASIGLDAVLAQVPNYRKSGFTETAWLNERRNGSIVDLVESQEKDLATKINQNEIEGLVLLSDPNVDFEQLPGLEIKGTGLIRHQFTKDWARFHSNQSKNHRAGAAVLSADKKDPITGKPLVLGYGCVRPATASYRVGPLYAANAEIAKQLLVKLAIEVIQADKQSSLGIPLMFDVDMPDKNPAAVELFNGLGWKNTFPCLRMWKGKVPEYDISGVFGVSSLELG
ncbi:hypothetical protein FBU30_009669 [Linnemannia zychae]|nr:hypothetical protein FBU30_009669 [Linnemannia zychae]